MMDVITYPWWDPKKRPQVARSPHDDVIKWKHFPRNWPFVRKIHRSPVNFPHKGQWRGALMFSLIYVWINDWANNREAGDLRRYPVHYDVIVMNENRLWHAPFRLTFPSIGQLLHGICLTHCRSIEPLRYFIIHMEYVVMGLNFNSLTLFFTNYKSWPSV